MICRFLSDTYETWRNAPGHGDPGLHTYDVTAGLDGYDDSDAVPVTITAGEEATANFELVETAE